MPWIKIKLENVGSIPLKMAAPLRAHVPEQKCTWTVMVLFFFVFLWVKQRAIGVTGHFFHLFYGSLKLHSRP